ncbi:hypothetical protein BD626DRAFT_505130 [Schizophyllum amplum]|uniref:Uncharacterized protein n=1 Tax=Schizophyllum amplum TaxID=97359 RepID=A0A550C6G0_9AGAR|nr:hypothetical protein BD626DRAFT_505130 [Auriculariopsis ampla]
MYSRPARFDSSKPTHARRHSEATKATPSRREDPAAALYRQVKDLRLDDRPRPKTSPHANSRAPPAKPRSRLTESSVPRPEKSLLFGNDKSMELSVKGGLLYGCDGSLLIDIMDGRGSGRMERRRSKSLRSTKTSSRPAPLKAHRSVSAPPPETPRLHIVDLPEC